MIDDRAFARACSAVRARRNRQGGQHFQLADNLDDVMLQDRGNPCCKSTGSEPKRRLPAVGLWGRDSPTLLQEYGITCRPGGRVRCLLAQGTRSDHLVFLRDGPVARDGDGSQPREPDIVSRFLPGAIVGEIAYYAGVDRTATLSAETASTVICIDCSCA